MNPHTKALPISLSILECFYRINIFFTTAVSSGKCNEKYPFSNDSGNSRVCLSVMLFHFSVSWSPEIHMLHLKRRASMQTHIPFRTLEFRSLFFVDSGTGPSSLPFQRSVFFVSWVKSVQLADEWDCVSCLVVWSWGTLPVSWRINDKTIESGKFQSLKNSFLFQFEGIW